MSARAFTGMVYALLAEAHGVEVVDEMLASTDPKAARGKRLAQLATLGIEVA